MLGLRGRWNQAGGAAAKPPLPRGGPISRDLQNDMGVAGESWDEKRLGAPGASGPLSQIGPSGVWLTPATKQTPIIVLRGLIKVTMQLLLAPGASQVWGTGIRHKDCGGVGPPEARRATELNCVSHV